MSRKSKGIPLSCLSASAQAQALAKLAELDRPPVITPEQADAIADRSQWAPYRNKTEWRFAAWLADHYSVATIAYECLKIQIGTINGKPSWYMPDFVRVSVTARSISMRSKAGTGSAKRVSSACGMPPAAGQAGPGGWRSRTAMDGH